jgi:LCP family protein required for cell wall assembly
LIVVAVFAVISASVVGYGWYRYSQIGRTSLNLDSATAGGPENYLIIGSDSRSVVDASSPDAGAFLNAQGADQGGQRSDTIMIARVDPKAKTVDLVSFPRDLWVPISPSGSAERINTAYSGKNGAQALIDTIKNDFGIPINHYVEINFKSFKGIVDAVGGVSLYFDTSMRDKNTGLGVTGPACVKLDGTQGLAFARSRHLEYKNANGRWIEDPASDLGRIARQQLFIRKTFDKAATTARDLNPVTLNNLVSSLAGNVTIDSKLSIDHLISLANSFKGFSGDQMTSHTLPVTPFTTSGGAEVLRLDQTGAQPILEVFRTDSTKTSSTSVPPTGTSTGQSAAVVSVAVSNASGLGNAATKTSTALDALGYHTSVLTDSKTHQARTIIHYRPGFEQQATLLSQALSGSSQLQSDTTLSTSPIEIVIGGDFTGISATAKKLTPPNGQSSSASRSTTTTSPPIIDQPVGIVPGQAPAGTTCG